MYACIDACICEEHSCIHVCTVCVYITVGFDALETAIETDSVRLYACIDACIRT